LHLHTTGYASVHGSYHCQGSKGTLITYMQKQE